MYQETKKAVRKALRISKTLFSMSPEKYRKLVEITKKIEPPVVRDVELAVNDGMEYVDAIAYMFQEKYKTAAVNSGFTEEEGLAILNYAAMLKELNS